MPNASYSALQLTMRALQMTLLYCIVLAAVQYLAITASNKFVHVIAEMLTEASPHITACAFTLIASVVVCVGRRHE